MDKMPTPYQTYENNLRKLITQRGIRQEDGRLNRTTVYVPGIIGILKHDAILELQSLSLIDKYTDDLKRMTTSLEIAIKNAKEDLNSRRLMVLNTDNFNEIYQCFTSAHFVYTGREEFNMYVYQRSADLAKLKDDSIFYSKIAQLFQLEVGKQVTKIIVFFGHIHVQV